MSTRDTPAISRRRFLREASSVGAATFASVTVAAAAHGQGGAVQVPAADSSNLFAMDQTASRPVALPPKPGARASMVASERDTLEHHLRCQCGCTMDVYTCRTTDFSCRVSPAMHRDVMALVQGGYTAEEIIGAFRRVYGEQVLMAPTAEGFNLFGWVAPFIALSAGAVVILALLKSWQRSTMGPASRASAHSAPGIDATEDELARLDAAIRDDA
jgi:cytochrome c-type biogenesis protein CcmH